MHVKSMNITLDKLLDKVFLLYTPIRAQDEKCYDIFSNYNGVMMDNTGFIHKDFSKYKLSYFGGIASILPLFYFLSNISISL